MAFGLSLSAVWFGLVTAMFDAVAKPVWLGSLVRNQEPPPTRLAAMLLACLGQTLLGWVIVKIVAELHGPAFPEAGLMALTSCAGLALGCLIGAIVRRPDFAVATSIVALSMMAVFGRGLLTPRPVADAMPTRWAYEGLLSMEHTVTLPAPRETLTLPGIPQPHGVSACALALGLMLFGFSGAAAFLSWEPRTPLSPESFS